MYPCMARFLRSRLRGDVDLNFRMTLKLFERIDWVICGMTGVLCVLYLVLSPLWFFIGLTHTGILYLCLSAILGGWTWMMLKRITRYYNETVTWAIRSQGEILDWSVGWDYSLTVDRITDGVWGPWPRQIVYRKFGSHEWKEWGGPYGG